VTGIAGAPGPPRAALARASGLVAFSACCFGSIPIFVSLGIGAGATLLTLLTWRYAIGAALLVGIGGGPVAMRLPRARWLPLLLVGGVGQALVAGVSLSALRYIPAATLSFLFYTYPAWVAVFAAVRRTEPITTRRLLALGLSFGGIALMVGSPWSAPMHPIGVGLALASALLYAMYVPAIGRLQHDIAPPVSAAYISVGAFVVLLALAAGPGVVTVRLAPIAWMAVIGLGLLSTAIGFIAFLRGLRVLGPVRTAIISTVEPFWTALMGSLVLAQALTASTLAGGLLIGGAVVILQLPARARASA
jgi:drug/metabolite transporter (DMT)-like permease